MAQHDESTCDMVERRLLEWAAWKMRGRSGDGYPTKSVLHPSWSPPTPGRTPTMMTTSAGSETRERQVDECVQELRPKLRDAIVVRYLMRADIDEQVRRAGCTADGVRKRVQMAKEEIAIALRTS